MMKASVNKIIPFSSVDGPGNRTAVFLQGCNINCRYCHNPETRNLCENCGDCIKTCPTSALKWKGDRVVWFPELCVKCDTCLRTCTHGSTPKVLEMTVEEVYSGVKKQIPFIRGLTFSGGECMLHAEFMLEVFRLAKKDGLSCLVDSNGTIPFADYPELVEVMDGVMLDLKAFYSKDHLEMTDSDNKVILENAVFLAERGKLEEVRTVVVPDAWNMEKNLEALAEFLQPLYKKYPFRIKLIAFRPMGVRKEYACHTVPGTELMNRLGEYYKKMGMQDIVII